MIKRKFSSWAKKNIYVLKVWENWNKELRSTRHGRSLKNYKLTSLAMKRETWVLNQISTTAFSIDEPIPEIDVPIMRFTHLPVHLKISSVRWKYTCEHWKSKAYCKDCGGSQICEHNRQRGFCKDCGGSQICEHDRIRKQCKDCEESQICPHKKTETVLKRLWRLANMWKRKNGRDIAENVSLRKSKTKSSFCFPTRKINI